MGGTQKFIEIDDEKKLRALYDKRISQEVNGEDLGEEFAGYVSIIIILLFFNNILFFIYFIDYCG